ncbi:murein biosynthesis integral membrane protein MurJ [Kineosporia sp. NBRC 101731]|uniref:murein biosynthesis integral membrane protein MurJ n=1 Tax=Kineosporia sp. NBRC 101731 TaxID=3032199 RepID=UPI0024A2D796|nr:murein biosynthesis integral membrane protein MurJ [Kineosporia sp. NBRC 101731]GLY26890.1 hypothetical protein Kisp02_02550 [Kineosporia sp. NBRC 101731]
MSGWSSDDGTPVPSDDPDRPMRPRRADGQHPQEQYPQDQYEGDPYAAQRESEYVSQHEGPTRRSRSAQRQAQRQAQQQPPPAPQPQQPADAWWNQPPAEPRRRRPRPAPPRVDQGDQPVAPADPTRPVPQEFRRPRNQHQDPQNQHAVPLPVAPEDPTVQVRPYRPEQARYAEGEYGQAGASGQGGGYGQYDEPYDQTRDDRTGPGDPEHGGSDPGYDNQGYQQGYEQGYDDWDSGSGEQQQYFHPLDPETPAPGNSRRGRRAAQPPPPTPDSPYDLSGLDPAELTGSLNLLGLVEGTAMPSDVTRPIAPIRAPIARAPRRPLPPVAPRSRDDRGYDDRGYDEHGYDDWDYGDRGQAEPDFEAADQDEDNRAQSASRASSLLGSSALMAAGTMVSRLLGFVRASVLVAAVTPGGDAGAADAFSVANIMPNALYILLAGGVLNAVLVPQIARAAKQKDGGEDYINRLLTAALGLLAVVTVLVLIGSPLLVKVYASDDWDPDLIALTAAFSLWCLPQVFFYGVYTLLGQVLNARGKFGAFMWSPVLNNVVSIAGLAAFIAVYGGGTQSGTEWTGTKVMLLAGSQTLGVATQALVLIPLLSRAGIRYRPKFGLRGVGLASASRVAGWTFAAVVVQQLAFVVISKVTTTASNLLKDHPDAAINTGKAIYDNALLLFMLPHSLVAVSLVTALFTRMSNAAAENRIRDVRADLSLGLRLTGLATVVSTAAILALGPDIAASMFPSANRSTTNGIAYVVMAMAVGLVPFSAQYLFQRVFFAFEDAKTPFFIQIATSGTWAAGNLVSLYLLRESPQYIVIGVGLSMAASNFVSALLSYWILRMRFGDLDGRAVVRSHIELFAVGGIGGGVAWLMARSTHIFLGDGWVTCIIATVVGGLMLLFIYVAGLRQLGVQEIEDVFGPLLRRLPSSPETVARHSTY